MAFTLTDLVEIIDDCIEEGKQIGIATNKHIARIIEQYLDEYDMNESFNMLNKTNVPSHFDKIKSDCVVVINCKDEFEYYIDYYELNEKLYEEFDTFVLIGEQFEDIKPSTIKARNIGYVSNIEINDEDIADIFADEFDYEDCNGEKITQEEHDRWVKAETCDCDECMKCREDDQDIVCRVECKEPKLTEYCAECDDYDCEFQGEDNDEEDCECDECKECKENETVTEEDFLILVTEAILNR